MTSRDRNRDLAATARDAARDSAGIGRKAWLIVAVALDASRTASMARRILSEMEPGELQTLALACHRTLYSDDTAGKTA
jgi:hypothetical protein